jgi:multidrug efflux pump subunit AcrA (membrane-fusion protein)
MKRSVIWFLLACFLLIGGCRQVGEDVDMAVVLVVKGPFTVSIPARGELSAVKSTRIKGAANINGPQILAWMAPENSWVKKDDPVIRMDPTWFEEQIRSETANVTRLDIEIRQKELQQAKEKSDILQQVELTGLERGQADLYAARDLSVYSRNKIIEDAINLDFLTTKSAHFQRILTRLEKKSRTEVQLLELKRKSSELKLMQHKQALTSLEIKAPHDGLLIYSKNWRGEKPRLGMNVWSGHQLAELPDLTCMEAVIHVHESESAGLAGDLPVRVFPEAYPGMVLSGKVTAVAQVANPIEQDSPAKYFEVKVEIPPGSLGDLKPGSLVTATIEVLHLDQVIAIPNQALQSENGKTWVWVRRGSGMEKRDVEAGQRSVTRTVINKGLGAGEEILLGNPSASNGRGH